MRRHFLPQLWLQSQRQIMTLVKWILICDISTSHNNSESYLEKYYPEILSLLFQVGSSYQCARKKTDCAQALFFFFGKLGGLELLWPSDWLLWSKRSLIHLSLIHRYNKVTPFSFEIIFMLGKIKDRRRRGWQRMKWLYSITDLMDLNLSKHWEIVKDREVWCAAIHGVSKSQTQLSDWTTTDDIHFPFSFNIAEIWMCSPINILQMLLAWWPWWGGCHLLHVNLMRSLSWSD